MPAATFYSSTEFYQRVIDKVEMPLVKLFSFASKWLPEPTIENTNKYNAHLLIGMRNTLIKKWFGEKTHIRAKAIRAMFNFIISKYDRDNINGGYLDDFLAEWAKSDWIFGRNEEALLKALGNKEFDKVLQLVE